MHICKRMHMKILCELRFSGYCVVFIEETSKQKVIYFTERNEMKRTRDGQNANKETKIFLYEHY